MRGGHEATVHVLVQPIELVQVLVQALGAVDREGQALHLRRLCFAQVLGAVLRDMLLQGFEAFLERQVPLLRLRLERNTVSDLCLHHPHDVCLLLRVAIAIVRTALVIRVQRRRHLR
eukprot:scaffold126979_cov66-Phaeocystis_antarctica.AAC.3